MWVGIFAVVVLGSSALAACDTRSGQEESTHVGLKDIPSPSVPTNEPSRTTEAPARKATPPSRTEPSSEGELDDRPVEELTEQELEIACFEGRNEACDLLGH